jgi:NAD(P)-dependent dehydrogenase (short-subunit alcohol dehydrogenase family)
LHAGIGLAIANYLLKDSAKHNLIILGGRSEDALEKLKAQSPQHIKVIPGDLSDFSLSQRAVDIAVSAFGKVDGLIVNHGILGEVARIADCDPSGIRKTFDVNFFSAIACVS